MEQVYNIITWYLIFHVWPNLWRQ